MNQDAFATRPVPVVVPDLGGGTDPVRFLCSLIQPGAQVIPGERIAELLVQGVVFQLEAEWNGQFDHWTVVPGQQVQTGETLGIIQVIPDHDLS